MAFVYGDRVKESSSTIGTGAVQLEGAASGFQTFEEGIGEGNETYYIIINDTQGTWEIGIGTYTAGELHRDTVLASTSGGSLVNFGEGTKTVGATISKEFYGDTVAASTHPSINHMGIPGVPTAEEFTATAHDAVDHTVPPFGLLQPSDHGGIDHTLPPLLLQTFLTHATLDHTGVPGVNNFDEALHLTTNHGSVMGVPAPEVFDAAAHALTDHTGLPGVGGVPSIDNQVQIVHNWALSNSLILALPVGTWTVFAYGAYRVDGINNLTTDLRIASVTVSTWGDDNNPSNWNWYKHFGMREGIAGGVNVPIDFDLAESNPPNPDPTPVCFAFAVRTA